MCVISEHVSVQHASNISVMTYYCFEVYDYYDCYRHIMLTCKMHMCSM